MVTFLPSYTDQNRSHKVEGQTLERVEATTLGWRDSAHMESTRKNGNLEILRKF